MFKMCYVLSEPTFRVNMHKKEKHCIFGTSCLNQSYMKVCRHTIDILINDIRIFLVSQ